MAKRRKASRRAVPQKVTKITITLTKRSGEPVLIETRFNHSLTQHFRAFCEARPLERSA